MMIADCGLKGRKIQRIGGLLAFHSAIINHRSSISSLSVVLRPPVFSVAAFGVLLICFVASTAVFYELARRWTHERPRFALAEWAKRHRFALRFAPRATVPAALSRLVESRQARANVVLNRGPLTLARLISAEGIPRQHWHVLIRAADAAWMPAGLAAVDPHPASQRLVKDLTVPASLIDVFNLQAFPAASGERFVAMAADSRSARALGRCGAGGLLPPDVSLLLYGSHVMLDFSGRPFDAVEFDRMLAVMRQLEHHLPAPMDAAGV